MSRTVRRRTHADTADAARRRLGGLLPVSAPTGAAAGGWVPEPPSRPCVAEDVSPSVADVVPPSVADETAVDRRVGSHRAPRLPAILADARLAIAPRAVVALLLVALVSVLVAGAWAWRARAQVVAVAPPRGADRSTSEGVAPPAGARPPGKPAASSSTSTVAPSSSPAAALVVHVVGQVRHPGVVTLAVGARVQDAVKAAGGAKPTAQLSALNLARLLVDGEQVVVPAPGEVVAPPVAGGQAPGGSATGTAGGTEQPVNLNTATLDQLQELPGVGPVLAQRILDWRSEHGSFRSVDELQDVSGIGAAKYADLEPRVRT